MFRDQSGTRNCPVNEASMNMMILLEGLALSPIICMHNFSSFGKLVLSGHEGGQKFTSSYNLRDICRDFFFT